MMENLFKKFNEYSESDELQVTPIKKVEGPAEMLYPALESVFSLPPLDAVEKAVKTLNFQPLQKWLETYEEGELLCSPYFEAKFLPEVAVTIITATSGRRIRVFLEGEIVWIATDFSSEHNLKGSQCAAYGVLEALPNNANIHISVIGEGRTYSPFNWMTEEIRRLERLLQMEEMKDIVQGVLLDGALQEIKETGTLSPETKEALAPMMLD